MKKLEKDVLIELFEIYEHIINGTHIYPLNHPIYRLKTILENGLNDNKIALHYPDNTLQGIYNTPIDAWKELNNNKHCNPEII